MRDLVLQMQVSIDGFVAGDGGDLSWVLRDFDASFEAWTAGKLWRAGAHLMGRVTYGDMAAVWPSSTDSFAAPMNRIPKVVFSRTLSSAPWGETRIVSGDPTQEIRRLKEQSGDELLAHGGASFARFLAGSGLIDEYRLVVHSVALGGGLRLFSDLPAPLRLELVDTVAFGKGAVAQVYRRP